MLSFEMSFKRLFKGFVAAVEITLIMAIYDVVVASSDKLTGIIFLVLFIPLDIFLSRVLKIGLTEYFRNNRR